MRRRHRVGGSRPRMISESEVTHPAKGWPDSPRVTRKGQRFRGARPPVRQGAGWDDDRCEGGDWLSVADDVTTRRPDESSSCRWAAALSSLQVCLNHSNQTMVVRETTLLVEMRRLMASGKRNRTDRRHTTKRVKAQTTRTDLA